MAIKFTFLIVSENTTLLDANGIRDPKMLIKLREEAAVRRTEVEQYQQALSSLIRDKSLPVIGVPAENFAVRSSSAKPQKVIGRAISAKSENHKFRSAEATAPRPARSAHKLAAIKNSSDAKIVELNGKSKARALRSDKKAKPISMGKSLSSEIPAKSQLQPVKHINHLLKYEETESSGKSSDLLTPPESVDEKIIQSKKRRDHRGPSSNGSAISNADYDNDSNIGAINSEYQEKVR